MTKTINVISKQRKDISLMIWTPSILINLITFSSAFHFRPSFVAVDTIRLGSGCVGRFGGSCNTSLRLSENAESTMPPSEMKAREIASELKGLGVPYADCFDRESLARRLSEAREGKAKIVQPTPVSENATTEEAEVSENATTEEAEVSENATTAEAEDQPQPETVDSGSSGSMPKDFDREAMLSELRQLRVSELRSQLGERNIRWSNMIEKEDLVRALVDDMEQRANFSLSGSMTPGAATDVDADILAAELDSGIDASSPLILDVYATWCGPCQLMAPHLTAAAEELGDSVRVAKIDSDKYPDWAERLKVGGLPTVIVFSKAGKEVARQEGALMKDNLIELVKPFL